MKKGIVILSLSLAPILLIILLIGSFQFPQAVMSEAGHSRELPSQYLFAAAENPLLRPWFDRAAQVLQDSPELARFVAGTYLADGIVEPQTPPVASESFLMTFPHTVDGSGGPGQPTITSSVLVLNNGGANAQGVIILRKTDGSPMVVNTNLGRDSNFPFSLTSGQELRLETDGSGPTQQGWVEVVSDVKLSGSGLFTVFDAQGTFISEVGIGDSVRATRLMVYVDTTGGKSTGVGITNPNAEGMANLTYKLRGLDGSEIAQAAPDQLAAGNQKAFFAVQAFPAVNLTNFKGVLIIESDVPISVVTLRTRGLNFTSFPAVPEAVDDGEDEYTLYFPRIGDGVFGEQGFVTSIILLNNSALAVSATVDLFQASGSPLELVLDGTRASQFMVAVPAGGAAELISDGSTDPGVVGWVRVTSDKPLGGGAAFLISDSQGGFISEVGIPSSPLGAKPALVARVGDGVSTGFALTNPNDLEVVAKLRLIGRTRSGAGPAGQGPTVPEIIAETTLDLGPNGHQGLFVSQVFGDVPAVQAQDFEGRMEIEAFARDLGESSLAPISGLTLFLRTSALGTSLTAAPLAPHEVNFGPATTVVPATFLAGSEPAFCLNSRQLAGEAPLGRATITLDSGSIDFSQLQDSEFVGKSLTTIIIFQLAAKTYVTEVMPGSSLFFAPISFDGISESSPSWSRMSNLPGSGIRFEIISNAVGEAPTEFPALVQVCFESRLLQLPNNPGGSIRVTEQYASQDLDPADGGPLESTRFSVISLEGVEPGAPRVDSIDSRQVIGGQEIVLNGSFAANPANNQVTVEGGSRVEAEVLSGNASELRVRLPFDVASGPLRVMSGGKTSNDYDLDVLFAPRSEISFSGSPGGNANLRLELNQRRGEILFMEVGLQPGQGQWITSGFAVDENVGTLRVTGSVSGAGSDLELRVVSSAAEGLTLHAVEPGDDDPEFRIEISNSSNPSFVLLVVDDLGVTTLAPQGLSTVLETATPIFNRPNGAFQVEVTMKSQPERAFFPTTSRTVQQTHSQ